MNGTTKNAGGFSNKQGAFNVLRAFTASLAIGLALTATMSRAEDPLLGIIKAIKCVGCEPGKVTLVVHDPIDVRDFDVTILDSDYGKIVTPLPGKQVYDRGDGCFYWNDKPKAPKKDPLDSPRKTGSMKTAKKDTSAPGASKDSNGSAADSNGQEAPAPDIEMKPSRCLPFVKVVPPKSGKPE